MTRAELIKLMLAARTRAECREAQAAARAWLKEHPGDQPVLEAGEQLYMMSTALEV